MVNINCHTLVTVVLCDVTNLYDVDRSEVNQIEICIKFVYDDMISAR